MSANFEAKKVVVAEIKEKIQNAKSVVFVKFNGLTVAEDTELRREFRKNNVEYKVLKNTLIRKAFNDLGVTDFDEDLNGPTSVAFGADETGAAKVIVDAYGIKDIDALTQEHINSYLATVAVVNADLTETQAQEIITQFNLTKPMAITKDHIDKYFGDKFPRKDPGVQLTLTAGTEVHQDQQLR